MFAKTNTNPFNRYSVITFTKLIIFLTNFFKRFKNDFDYSQIHILRRIISFISQSMNCGIEIGNRCKIAIMTIWIKDMTKNLNFLIGLR